MSLSITDLKSGVTIYVEGEVYQVIESQHVKPGKGGAFVRTKLKNLYTGANIEKTFRAGEKIEQAILETKKMQFLFKDEYYNYDYIGAPSHCGRVGDNFILGFGWQEYEQRTVVQNGGFSLRSLKFLQAPNHFGITHKQANDIHNWNEDAQLTAIFRADLEVCGMKYATEDVAKEFSIEYVGPGFHDGFDFTKLVGHHAQSRKLVADNYIRVSMPHGEIKNLHGETEFIKFLSDMGYTIEYTYDRSNNKKTA